MTNDDFKLVEVHEKPSRRYRKGSKYDPVVDKFMNGKANLVKVEIEGKEANYVRTQLKKRIDARSLNDKLEVSVVNNVTYLEKL
jgi:hypothetical protein